MNLPNCTYSFWDLLGYVFPALIAALVPFRAYVVTCFFDAADLVYLDPMDEAFTPPSSSNPGSNNDGGIPHSYLY